MIMNWQALYKQASHVQKTPWTSIMSQRRAERFFACKTHTLVKQNEIIGLFLLILGSPAIKQIVW